MSLIQFHRFLIVCGILFCLGFGGWELWSYMQGAAGVGALLLTASFVVLALLLGTYLRHLNRWLGYQEKGPRER